MTQYELDNIDLRADTEIYKLLCCAVVKCRVEGRRPSARLMKKFKRAEEAFENSLPPGKVYRMYCDVESDGNGRPMAGGHIECVINILDKDEATSGEPYNLEDDEDDL